MAAVSSSKWTSFYNDPPPSDYNEEEDTSTGELLLLRISLPYLYGYKQGFSAPKQAQKPRSIL